MPPPPTLAAALCLLTYAASSSLESTRTLPGDSTVSCPPDVEVVTLGPNDRVTFSHTNGSSGCVENFVVSEPCLSLSLSCSKLEIECNPYYCYTMLFASSSDFHTFGKYWRLESCTDSLPETELFAKSLKFMSMGSLSNYTCTVSTKPAGCAAVNSTSCSLDPSVVSLSAGQEYTFGSPGYPSEDLAHRHCLYSFETDERNGLRYRCQVLDFDEIGDFTHTQANIHGGDPSWVFVANNITDITFKKNEGDDVSFVCTITTYRLPDPVAKCSSENPEQVEIRSGETYFLGVSNDPEVEYCQYSLRVANPCDELVLYCSGLGEGSWIYYMDNLAEGGRGFIRARTEELSEEVTGCAKPLGDGDKIMHIILKHGATHIAATARGRSCYISARSKNCPFNTTECAQIPEPVTLNVNETYTFGRLSYPESSPVHNTCRYSFKMDTPRWNMMLHCTLNHKQQANYGWVYTMDKQTLTFKLSVEEDQSRRMNTFSVNLGSAAEVVFIRSDDPMEGNSWKCSVEPERSYTDGCQPEECGLSVFSKGRLTNRIVEGSPAAFMQFPWQAIVKIDWQFCNGVLINRHYILTAAHCVSSESGKTPFYLPTVFLGKHDSAHNNETYPVQKYEVVRVILHPSNIDDSSGYTSYDIALLRLSRPVQYADHIRPVCLPPRDYNFEDHLGVVSGWGILMEFDNPAPSDALHAASLPIISLEECKNRSDYTQLKTLEMYGSSVLCAGREHGGHSGCWGVSGGPLTVELNGRATLAGVLNGNMQCKATGLYAKVSHTSTWDWIMRHVGMCDRLTHTP